MACKAKFVEAVHLLLFATPKHQNGVNAKRVIRIWNPRVDYACKNQRFFVKGILYFLVSWERRGNKAVQLGGFLLDVLHKLVISKIGQLF